MGGLWYVGRRILEPFHLQPDSYMMNERSLSYPEVFTPHEKMASAPENTPCLPPEVPTRYGPPHFYVIIVAGGQLLSENFRVSNDAQFEITGLFPMKSSFSHASTMNLATLARVIFGRNPIDLLSSG